MAGRAAVLALVAALLAAGCSVARLPETAAARDQSATQHRLDAADCKAEVGYRHNYNGDDSPLANALRNVFVLGTSGAALGGFFTGLPTTLLRPSDCSRRYQNMALRPQTDAKAANGTPHWRKKSAFSTSAVRPIP
jgi:hypothetical protein